MNDTEPPSDPERRVDETAARADLRRLVVELRKDVASLVTEVGAMRTELAESRGAAKTWRVIGGLAATIAIGLGGVALTLGSQASADHERVSRHETLIDSVRDDMDEINRGVARIEGALDRREE